MFIDTGQLFLQNFFLRRTIFEKSRRTIFALTRPKKFIPPLILTRAASEWGSNIWKKLVNLGYMPLKYLRLTPKTSKVIQNRKRTIFFFPVTVPYCLHTARIRAKLVIKAQKPIKRPPNPSTELCEFSSFESG